MTVWEATWVNKLSLSAMPDFDPGERRHRLSAGAAIRKESSPRDSPAVLSFESHRTITSLHLNGGAKCSRARG
jgi:hypothetical protein